MYGILIDNIVRYERSYGYKQGSVSMSRPLRIEYPGAIYHITSRGNARADIYLTNTDRTFFLDLLARVCARYNWHCYAYCLMSNHYHLVIETAAANLSKGMRQLNGLYTQTINRTQHRVGHLFQGRYKAIVVEKDSYLLEVIRYVILNPVRAHMTNTAGQYPWSSYRAMIGKVDSPDWLHKDWVLSQFGRQASVARKHFVKFIREGSKQPPLWEHLKHQLYLGDEHFVTSLQSRQGTDKDLSEVPRAQRRKRGEPLSCYSKKHIDRNDAIYAAYRCGTYTQKEISNYFDIHYSSVSKIVKKHETEGMI